MSNQELGRVLNTAALDASEGPRARLQIDIPATWLDEGAELEIHAPGRLPCARCDGGGCDSCGRSGALRAPSAPEDRRLHARVSQGGRDGVVLRIPKPFGTTSNIDQLWLEVRAGAAPSAGIMRVGTGTVAPRRSAVVPWFVVGAIVTGVSILLSIWLR